MKLRKWSVLVMLAVMILSFALPAQAADDRFVYDEADFLIDEEILLLESTAQDIALTYSCGVYIVTTWDYSGYGSTVRSAAENYFTANGLGIGSDRNGVMLFLSMADRDYALIAHGDLANAAFTDYGKDILSGEFLDNFAYDDWIGGFQDYLYGCRDFLNAAISGEPVDVEGGSDSVGMTVLMLLVVPAAIAGVACGVMAASMKTARAKTQADDYRKGVNITGQRDQFITRTVVRQKIESSSSSSSSRGGTRVNSGGFSGKSGKF